MGNACIAGWVVYVFWISLADYSSQCLCCRIGALWAFYADTACELLEALAGYKEAGPLYCSLVAFK